MSIIASFAWRAVSDYRSMIATTHLRIFFAADHFRFSRFSIQVEDLLVDFSKQRIDAKAIQLLTALAEAADLSGWRERLFAGEKINASEGRAVLHPALRHLKLGAFPSAAWDVMPEVRAVREQMRAFSDSVRAGFGGGDGGEAEAVVVAAVGPDFDGVGVALGPLDDGVAGRSSGGRSRVRNISS